MKHWKGKGSIGYDMGGFFEPALDMMCVCVYTNTYPVCSVSWLELRLMATLHCKHGWEYS